MNDFMLWILRNIGSFGFISVAAIFLLLGLGGIIDVEMEKGGGWPGGNPGFNRWQKIISWIIAAIICGLVGIFCLYIAVNVIDAPVSWFRGLPAGESVVMKTKMLKHEKPLTIYQFYEVQHKYQDLVELNQQEHAQFNVMKDGVVYSTKK